MGRNRFVNTNPLNRETVKVELSDGDFVLFKKQLTNGEDRRIKTSGFGGLKGNIDPKRSEETELEINWNATELERVFTWMHGWSFVNGSGQAVQFNRENLENLDVETFEEIKAKLDDYIADKEKEKNAGSPGPSSPSESNAAGTSSAPSPS